MVLVAKQTHKRYANNKSYQFFKDGESKGFLLIERKMSEEELHKELLDFAKMSGADKIVLDWTARDGFVKREVHL